MLVEKMVVVEGGAGGIEMSGCIGNANVIV